MHIGDLAREARSPANGTPTAPFDDEPVEADAQRAERAPAPPGLYGVLKQRPRP